MFSHSLPCSFSLGSPLFVSILTNDAHQSPTASHNAPTPLHDRILNTCTLNPENFTTHNLSSLSPLDSRAPNRSRGPGFEKSSNDDGVLDATRRRHVHVLQNPKTPTFFMKHNQPTYTIFIFPLPPPLALWILELRDGSADSASRNQQVLMIS